MKCRCGGDTVTTRVKITHRGKEYRPMGYKCKECNKTFYLTRFYIPLRGKAND